MAGITRTRPIFDLDRVGALIEILVTMRGHRESERAKEREREKSFSWAAQLEILYAMSSAPLCASYGTMSRYELPRMDSFTVR